MRTEQRPRATCTESLVKFGCTVLELCARTEKQKHRQKTDRRTHHNTVHCTHPVGEVMSQLKSKCNVLLHLGYLATSGAKSDVIFLLGDPDFPTKATKFRAYFVVSEGSHTVKVCEPNKTRTIHWSITQCESSRAKHLSFECKQ